MIRTLATGAAVAGAGALAACAQQGGAAQGAAKELPPPETTSVRIVNPAPCDPGMWLAKDYLLEEGFTDVRFVATPFTSRDWMTKGLADFALSHPEFAVGNIDAGLPLVVLTGLHSGCLELWVGDGITNVRDLRGKRISVRAKDISDLFYAFFATLLGYVGIDPLKDVQFVEGGDNPGMISAFAEGRADAVLAGGAQGPLLRRFPKPPGHVILETMTDKPWSTYFCCSLVANRDWARQNPIATKRFTRALLRATDAAAKDMPRASRDAAATGIGFDESIVAETMAMCTYNWRELEPEETLRFFGLRLADVKLIKSTPQQLLALGTDFTYMRQLRSELKS
ncbi:MAG: ABC transporter substrate-binding protein [Chloroflexota bacterium]|nr:ABC transporter substrate-binding protein [Chloroflexota bacterium]